MSEANARWPSFGYQPVPGLANRLISRYLRTQRKNMARLFEERGLFVFAERMNQIRKSRQGMLAKNRYFQEVLNDYSKLVSPAVTPTVPGSVLPSAGEHAPVREGGAEPSPAVSVGLIASDPDTTDQAEDQ